MTERYKPEHLAKEAERLTADPILLEAIARAKREAIENLLKAPADDMTEISKWQQQVAALEAVPRHLKRFIIALGDAE